MLSAYQHGGGALLLDRHGDLLARPTPPDRRTVPLEAPSAYLSEAFLAVEDKSFREHGGIDWLRVPGALLANLRSKEVEQDFSTITMQLARNVFPERISASQWRRELWRQAAREEVFLASRLPPERCPAGGGDRGSSIGPEILEGRTARRHGPPRTSSWGVLLERAPLATRVRFTLPPSGR